MAKSQDGQGDAGKTSETQSDESKQAKKRIWVRVICNGVLGKKLLPKGAVTDDPAYVALLGDPRNLVEEVK